MSAPSSTIEELVQALGLDTKSTSSDPKPDSQATIAMSTSASSSSSHLHSLNCSASSTPAPSEPRTPASENEKLKEAYIDIAAPVHSDLLTDYNTVRNTDIPAPLWARLDDDYREWKGIEATPEDSKFKLAVTNLGDGEGDGVLRASDGRPLRRIPIVRAIKNWEGSDEEDDEEDEDDKQVYTGPPIQSLKLLKEAAAKKRETNPSNLTIAMKKTEARVEAAREAKSEELEKIEKWDNAVRMLNMQRDMVVLERMKALEGKKVDEEKMIQGAIPSAVDRVEDDESRFEEV